MKKQNSHNQLMEQFYNIIYQFNEIKNSNEFNLINKQYNKFINNHYKDIIAFFKHKSAFYFKQHYHLHNNHFFDYMNIILSQLPYIVYGKNIRFKNKNEVISYILIYLRNNLLNEYKKIIKKDSIDSVGFTCDDDENNNFVNKKIFNYNLYDELPNMENEMDVLSDMYVSLNNKIANELMLSHKVKKDEMEIYKLYFCDGDLTHKDIIQKIYGISDDMKNYKIYEQRLKNKIRKLRKIIFNIAKKTPEFNKLKQYHLLKNNIKNI